MRPIFFRLFYFAFNMSMTAVVSILHRIAGILLCLSMPFYITLLSHVLNSQQIFPVNLCLLYKLWFIILAGAAMHYFSASVRFLLLDLGYGINKSHAILSARLVLICDVCAVLYAAASII